MEALPCYSCIFGSLGSVKSGLNYKLPSIVEIHEASHGDLQAIFNIQIQCVLLLTPKKFVKISLSDRMLCFWLECWSLVSDNPFSSYIMSVIFLKNYKMH